VNEERQLILESERGAHAERLLADPMLKECIARVEEDIIEKWKRSPPSLPEAQSLLRLKWQALQDVKAQIEHIAQTGRLASAQAEHEQGLRARAKAAMRKVIGD